jgi:anti-sigma B factor antagonist
VNFELSPHLHLCNNAGRCVPYTYLSMPNDDPLSIERCSGKTPDIVILKLTGPVTLRNLFGLQNELRSAPPPAVTILDLSGVPYMDSAGMGAVINHYVHCQNKGGRLIAAGVCCRALELFKLTKVHTIIPMFESVEEAEATA